MWTRKAAVMLSGGISLILVGMMISNFQMMIIGLTFIAFISINGWISGQSDLAATTSPDFEVVGVAKLVGVSAGALDLMSNFTQTKPSGVEGA